MVLTMKFVLWIAEKITFNKLLKEVLRNIINQQELNRSPLPSKEFLFKALF